MRNGSFRPLFFTFFTYIEISNNFQIYVPHLTLLNLIMESTANRLHSAKEFLFNNPSETKACVARIFGLPVTTLKNSIARNTPNKIDHRGGQNKILEQHQVEAIHKFIRSLLTHNIPPTKSLLFSSIQHLKRREDANFQGPSKRWFRGWWQANKLHTIKTKPLAAIRYSAAQVDDVHRWFDGYRVALRELRIKDKRNIINFDEAGFRVGCMKGQEILVPDDVNEFYAISPEDRKSLTVFEMINAAGDFPTPPLIVIQGQELMSNWFSENLPSGTRILTSENGFTSDKIALTFLQHFIENSDASPTSDWKLMLMDNHGSHLTPEFIQLANENHIRPYPLIPHMTHCMQPLDVAVFQPYKHWHDVAIQEAISEFDISYSISRFCHDLTKIRDSTFKKSTIKSAFQKSGMWPIDSTKCIAQLKKFVPQSEISRPLLSTSSIDTLPRIQPQTLQQVEQGLLEWKSKVQNHTQWSDPIREEELDTFVENTRKVVVESTFKEIELEQHHKRRREEVMARSTSRKRLKPVCGVLGLTKEDALQAIAEKEKKEEEMAKKKENANFMRIWRWERDNILARGVVARKEEKARKKRVKDFMKRGMQIPEVDLIPIEDPEVVWKANDVTWKAEEVRKQQAKNKHAKVTNGDESEGSIEFIVDTIGDHTLRLNARDKDEGVEGNAGGDAEEDEIKGQADFIQFEAGDEVDSGSEDDVQEQLGYY